MTGYSTTLAIGATLAAGLAGPLMAQSAGVTFNGAELSYRYSDSDDDYTVYQYYGSAEIGAGPVIVQLDFYSGGYDDEWSYDGLLLHVGYPVSPDLVVGVFYGEEDWGDSANYPVYGIEAAYQSGAFDIDAAFGTYEDNNSSDIYFNFLMVEAMYEITPNVSAGGYFANTSNSDYSDDLTVFGVLGRYDLPNGLFAELGLFTMSGDYEQNFGSIEIGYSFGNGVTQGARGWNDSLRQY